MSYFRTEGPGKEHGTNKPPPTGRVRVRSKGDTTCLTTSQNPCWHPYWLNKACTTRKDSESDDWLKTTWKLIHHHKPQSSSPGLPSPTPLHLGALSNKISCFVSTCVSSDNSFLSVRQEPTERTPGSGPLSFNSFIIHEETNKNGFLRKC